MSLNVLLGILLIAIGAFSSGSFAVPFGEIKGWKWESYWMVFSLGAYILFPLTACLVLAPEFVSIIRATPGETIIIVFLLGGVYGVGNLSFGLALRYLGLSLGYALALGLMLAIGTLIPPMIDGRLQVMIQQSGGTLLLLGVLVACVGIALSAWAGILKDKQVSDEKKQESIGEFDLFKGAMFALLVGITGSAMSLGFEQGLPISDIAAAQGVDPLFTMMPVLLVLFSGTFVTTIIWCAYLGYKNRSFKDYISASTSKVLALNYAFGLLAGLLWFAQFIAYGMGKSKMGPFTFTSWGILMALTIVFATVWGLIRKEWKGASTKVYVLMVFSLLVIIASSFMIGISGAE
ncbi:L-rhamnose/proton symporter RhaT [Sunxiuqinia sp. sy24]|uniref:L-rhamnose/proton symporter RhaT n=1 Tax=Sunxiuqinia sp. sy24 TaxID=3461495 RepID=UPI0040452197